MLKWILIPLLWSSALWAQSFTSGNEFTAYELSGNLYLTCYAPGQQVTVLKRCEQSILAPVSKDYFATEEKINGDRVRLVNVTNGDEGYEKTVYYNREKQRTHSKVDLWAEHWGQRALLQMGPNRIAYEFLNKNKDLLTQGIVDVYVDDGGSRFCRDGSAQSYDMYDCYYGDAQQHCEQYFRWNNYCD